VGYTAAVKIQPFATEEYFDLYEFAADHTLSASDCESLSAGELATLAGTTLEAALAAPLSYGPAAGNEELREHVAAKVPGLSAKDVVTLCAPEEGIFIAMHTLLQPGDRVVCMTPCYDSLANVARYLSCDVVPWPVRESGAGWALDLDDLSRLAVNAKLVVVNFPHNPTGVLPTREVFADLLQRVERAGARLFCDEMYRGLEMPGHDRLPSAVELSERALVLSGLSKAHGLPGLRAGWLTTRDASLVRDLVGWKHYTSICAPGPTQALSTLAVAQEEVLFKRNRARIVTNNERVSSFFGGVAGFSYRPPEGGSIAIVDTPWDDTAPVCHGLARDHNVILLPGMCLGAGAHQVRVGLGREGMEDALGALRDSGALSRVAATS